ncbi:MAG: MerR family transcriptional regulator [bacterium]|nr:MerR family transcriptional regulator [bacterium]
MYTISQVAGRFGLSRSTLLYYDSIGLLRPSARSAANYRLYTEPDLERMARIDVYRRAGIPLAKITQLLDSGESKLGEVLETRLRRLDEEILDLKRQQRLIATLMPDGAVPGAMPLDKQSWIAILEATGLDEDGMRRWHVEFERLSPDGHREFLGSLGIEVDEIERIRAWSKAEAMD